MGNLRLERIGTLDGPLLTCTKTDKNGRCIKYLQTCDGDDCLKESPAHPAVPGRTKKRKKRKAKRKTPPKKTTAKPKRTATATGQKEPWRMKKAEWDKAVDATHPVNVQSLPTRGSGSQAAAKIAEHERLSDKAYIWNEVQQGGVVNHKLVIAKAYLEGKKIPADVLAEYPDMPAFVKGTGYKKYRGKILDIIARREANVESARAEKRRLKIDMVYGADLDNSIKLVLDLNPQRVYYLWAKSPKRTYVESLSPPRGKPYVRIDKFGMVRRFDAEHKEIITAPAKPVYQPTNPVKWEKRHPPELLSTAKVKLKKGEHVYLISDNRRKDEGNDYRAVVGKPFGLPGFEFLDLFIHESADYADHWKVSDVATGLALTSGDHKEALMKRLALLSTQVSEDPERFIEATSKVRKISDYPHLVNSFNTMAAKLPQGTAGVGLAGDLLTCSRWIVTGVGAKKIIRCGSFKRTCQPGDPDCVEPGQVIEYPGTKKTKDIVTDMWSKILSEEKPVARAKKGFEVTYTSEEDAAYMEAWTTENDLAVILNQIKNRPRTVAMIATNRKLDPVYVGDLVRMLVKDNKAMMNTINEQQVVVITPAGKYSIGGKKEPTSQAAANWLKTKPFTKAEGESYQRGLPKHLKGAEINAAFNADMKDMEGFVSKRIAAEKVNEIPDKVNAALMDYRRALYNAYTARLQVTDRADRSKPATKSETSATRLREQQLGDAQNAVSRALQSMTPMPTLPPTERAGSPFRKGTPTARPTPAAVPTGDIWMQEKPFSKNDTDDYNRFTYYPSKDINIIFHGTVQAKLDEVNRRMKEYELKEIPADVQTALMWYRRRAYEMLKREIYSRNNAPGSFMVGASNYNVRKHNRVKDGDERYRTNLEKAGAKLDTAVRKMLKTKTGRPIASIKEREKWEATAVQTKRNAFGKIILENQIQYNIDNPDKAPQSIDLKDPKSTFRAVVREGGRILHKRLIADAFARNVAIAPGVLAEYPDLARPVVDVTENDTASWSHSKWKAWERRNPPILLNPNHTVAKRNAYLVQDRSQRKSKDQGWDYSIVDGFPISFADLPDGFNQVNFLILHKSTKTPGTFDISHGPSGAVMAAQSNPLDSQTKAVGQIKDWIGRDRDGFLESIDKVAFQRSTKDYPYMRTLFDEMETAKGGRRFAQGENESIMEFIKSGSAKTPDLAGIGTALQAINAFYSLSKVAGVL